MTAFVIGQMHIHSHDWKEEYFAKIPQVVSDNKGKFLVRGGDPEHLEGDNQLPDAAFVIEFPDRDHAKAFWTRMSFNHSRFCDVPVQRSILFWSTNCHK